MKKIIAIIDITAYVSSVFAQTKTSKDSILNRIDNLVQIQTSG